MIRRAAIGAAVVVVGWLAALLVLDATLAGRQADGTTARLTESLQATTTLGGADLALVRGRLELDHLAVHRDDAIGHLAIDVGEIRCELPPLGWALVDSECRELRVTAMHLDVSSVALFRIAPPKRPPVRAQRVEIDDAVLAFAPSAFLPSLGQIAVHIEHAESGATVFRTPLSWLLTLEQLRARIELPAGLALHLEFHDGKLAASGALFGAAPVEVPAELPHGAHDAREEIEQLVAAGKDLAERLVAKRAEDWLRTKLTTP